MPLLHAHYQFGINAILILPITTEMAVDGMHPEVATGASAISFILVGVNTLLLKEFRLDFSVPFVVVQKKTVQSICGLTSQMLDRSTHSDQASRKSEIILKKISNIFLLYPVIKYYLSHIMFAFSVK